MDGSNSRPRPVTDLSPVRWIVDRIGPFGSGVGALVPHDHEAYGRLLHPAISPREESVTWAAVADWSGGVMHSLAQFAPLSRPRPGSTGETRPWDEEPHVG